MADDALPVLPVLLMLQNAKVLFMPHATLVQCGGTGAAVRSVCGSGLSSG